jgi:hypothetical protein
MLLRYERDVCWSILIQWGYFYISQWDINNVTDMSYMFQGCANFKTNISIWK